MRHRLSILVVLLLAGPLARGDEPPKPPPPPPLDSTTRDFHQRHLELHVTPDIAAGSVKGEVRLSFESAVDGLKTLRLHSLETEVAGVAGEKGEALKFESKDGILSIALATPLNRGRTRS